MVRRIPGMAGLLSPERDDRQSDATEIRKGKKDFFERFGGIPRKLFPRYSVKFLCGSETGRRERLGH
jgi:hypothetical protein